MRTAGAGDGVVNSPYAIAEETVLTCVLWILMAPAVAGSAAARDAQTRMHPLIYAAPISKADYLGGRFLAALVLNASILLAVPLGILAALFLPGVDPGIVGPLRPAVYLSSYGVLALPTAFFVTAVQFSLAALNRRAIVSYLGSVFLFVIVSMGAGTAINVLHMPALGKLLDPIGFISILGLLSDTWTPLEKNRARGAERSLWSRLQVARRRSTRATAGVAATAVALIVTLGGFIFYNTNSLNRYRTASEETERRAEYERRYGKYAGVAHPTLASTNLRVEIYPDRREGEIRGGSVLANTSFLAIDSIHLTTLPGVVTPACS